MLRVTDPRSGTSGFTLIELVISAALSAMILVAAYMCLSSAVSSRKMIEPRVEVFQNARVAMAIMSADLRSACPLSKESMFLGMQRTVGDMEADNLDFATHNYMPQHANEGDFCQTSFYVDQDPESGQLSLWRRRNPTIGLDPLSGGSEEEIARGVRGLKFEYYDGYDWYDTWGEVKGRGKQQSSNKVQPNLSGMPEAV
ncbi:MAG TPA: prepilin-type N-terminal cleavage/methylation domain-containing protein, partial [Verrucomicrobiae bacterium]|nr:prepilin-type N-terminal cleavage/methylation domain-containing protein [Verrucomicrobiae bacterium]